jgi:hypothetical protein
LLQNNFDFNKLFKEGINYARLSDKNLVGDKVAKFLKEAPDFKRFYTNLGSQSSQTLESLITKVQHFVEKAKLDTNNQHNMELDIESYALKR